ncbi:hypothetical protein GCM10027445_64880 [Amycolatopsis endophytica]|uniref:Uncharacterized protein n=1 Tax=Amycolatopsis endophytica TaxID=860233 RepID=A0A853B5P9_9PSEU|nr:hypothetical protein [Amycolatopsis endophytica]NYI89876.1 hypothetical protein [Amycolatopsis endophytica]
MDERVELLVEANAALGEAEPVIEPLPEEREAASAGKPSGRQ